MVWRGRGGEGRGRQCSNGSDSTLIEVIGIFWLQVISPNAWCCPHITKCIMHQLHTSPHPTPSPPPIPHPTPHIPALPSTPSLHCTLQDTVDSTVLSDGGKGENSDPESEAVVTRTDTINEFTMTPPPGPSRLYSNTVLVVSVRTLASTIL